MGGLHGTGELPERTKRWSGRRGPPVGVRGRSATVRAMGWRIVGAVGRVLMTAGTLILLFVAYQLWGTGLQEARSQNDLSDEFAQLLVEAETTAPETTTTTEVPDPGDPVDVVPSDVQPRLPLPEVGDPVAQIEIPRIGITRTVVSGVTLDQLERGPGHYPNSPLPGQR